MKRWLACALLFGLLVGRWSPPATAADREHQQIMADIRMLQEQTLRLTLMLTSLDEAVRAVTAKLDTQADLTRKAFADSRLLIDNVSDGVRILREKMDETNVRIASLSQEVESLRVSMPQFPPMTALPVDPTTGLPAASDAAAAAPPPAPVAPGVSPQRMYDTARADYMAGQIQLAVQGFEAYIKTFPRSELADDAQYYIGQAYHADGKLAEAVAAYEQVLLNYPDGNAVPDASYKRGVALDGLGETDRARQAFELVVRNYPNSPAAALAQQALDRLTQTRR